MPCKCFSGTKSKRSTSALLSSLRIDRLTSRITISYGKLSWDDVGPVMAKYLGPLDIDIYIYITDDDRDYQYNVGSMEENVISAWKSFNEVALFVERLEREVQLSNSDAKAVARKRKSTEFTSFDDLKNNKNKKWISERSRDKIKSYIDRYSADTWFPLEKYIA